MFLHFCLLRCAVIEEDLHGYTEQVAQGNYSFLGGYWLQGLFDLKTRQKRANLLSSCHVSSQCKGILSCQDEKLLPLYLPNGFQDE